MKSDLVKRLLMALMEWDVPRFNEEVARVKLLSSVKYDGYRGYRPGVKFAEYLARWLEQFEPGERDVAFQFVMYRLVFVSDDEMAHLIEIAYQHVLEPVWLRRAAAQAGLPPYRVVAIANSLEFQALRRRSLILGLSDGARLDRLRRASGLSHEQFLQDYNVDAQQVDSAREQLHKAMDEKGLPGDKTFAQVVLVDDFSGSGESLARLEGDDRIAKGKLVKATQRLESLRLEGLLDENAAVDVLLYIATEQAQDHLQTALVDVGISDWTIHVVQTLRNDQRVDITDPEMTELCRNYFDVTSVDEHKGATPIGYSDCALPLVLDHNTPNNSVCLLWSESAAETDAPGRRGLFPRYERHHRDRP